MTNIGSTTVNNLQYQVAINGLGDYPVPTGDGGFAEFPNGGNIDLAPGQSYVAQNWLFDIYESRFNNTPPTSGLIGPMSISGTLSNTLLATNNLTVVIATPYSKWYWLTVNQTGNTASFSGNVPERDDWIIRVSGQGIKTETILASEINTQLTQLSVNLELAPSGTKCD